MTLSFDQTRFLIDVVLSAKNGEALASLNETLTEIGRSAPEFYEGVISHGPFMNYTSDQWLDFHLKVPHWRLRDEKPLMDKLSAKQRSML